MAAVTIESPAPIFSQHPGRHALSHLLCALEATHGRRPIALFEKGGRRTCGPRERH